MSECKGENIFLFTNLMLGNYFPVYFIFLFSFPVHSLGELSIGGSNVTRLDGILKHLFFKV